MNYATRAIVTSKFDPSITYVLNRMTWGRRNEFNEATARFWVRLAELAQERVAIEAQFPAVAALEKQLVELVAPPPDAAEDVRAAFEAQAAGLLEQLVAEQRKVPPAEVKRVTEIRQEERAIDRVQMAPVLLRWGLYSIRGLSIDGLAVSAESPAPVDLLIADGPEGLVEEICQEINRRMRLSGDEAKNSESPTTSAGVEDGRDRSTAAESASASSIT